MRLLCVPYFQETSGTHKFCGPGKISNRPVPIGTESILKKAIRYADSITLSYRDNVFSFEFAALSYANSQKNRYR